MGVGASTDAGRTKYERRVRALGISTAEIEESDSPRSARGSSARSSSARGSSASPGKRPPRSPNSPDAHPGRRTPMRSPTKDSVGGLMRSQKYSYDAQNQSFQQVDGDLLPSYYKRATR